MVEMIGHSKPEDGLSIPGDTTADCPADHQRYANMGHGACPYCRASLEGIRAAWPAVTDAWADTYCELTGRDPSGQQVTFVDGGVVTAFREVAKREIEAMLCAAPKPAVRMIGQQVGGWRLLTRADVIQRGDQTLRDDCETWGDLVGWEVGAAYRPEVMVPVRRRSTPTTASAVGMSEANAHKSSAETLTQGGERE